jgi:hypothetical protein
MNQRISDDAIRLHRREFLAAILPVIAAVSLGPVSLVEAIAPERISLVSGALGLCWGPVTLGPRERGEVIAVAPRDLVLESIKSAARDLIVHRVARFSAHDLPIHAYGNDGICFALPGDKPRKVGREWRAPGLHVPAGEAIAIVLSNPTRSPITFVAGAL